MRNRFDSQLAILNKELITMGALCENAIALAAKSMISGDLELASRVLALGSEIAQKERTIESMCLKLLLMQQPVARDLRQISSALKMITDMERIGDQAADIAEIVKFVDITKTDSVSEIGEMARATIKMVTDSVEAFVKQDLEIANSVIEYDDIVDALFCKIKNSLIDFISRRPSEGEYAVDILMITKHFERIGDHAVNIAEWVIFSVTGAHRGETEL